MAQTISNLSLGSKIRFGKSYFEYDGGAGVSDIIWTLVSKDMDDYSGYPHNAATLHSTYIIDWLEYDIYRTYAYNSSTIQAWLVSDSSYVSDYGRRGFLSEFSSAEKSLLLSGTTIPKVYIPLPTEIGNTSSNSSYNYAGRWGYYTSNAARIGYPSWLLESVAPSYFNQSTAKNYWSSAAVSNSGPVLCYGVASIEGDSWHGLLVNNYDTNEGLGVRPAIHLSLSTRVSDTTDASGCYTVITNTEPSAPSYIDVPTVMSGVPFTVSWGEATDPDGTIAGYTLYRRFGSGSYSKVYPSSGSYGVNRSYTDTVTRTSSRTSVQYRVTATDNAGGVSGYTTSSSVTISTNNPPTIVPSDGNLGTKSAAFTQTYTVSDADSDTVTVVEKIDGEQIRTYTATLGATNTFSVSGETWLKLLNGSHTMTVTATDVNLGTVTRTYSFVKSVTSFTLQNATPYSSADMPTRVKVYVTRSIPSGATFSVSVCNNGYDASPTWENITSTIDSNTIYEFTNDTKTASNWGVSIKVEVNRNGASGECYVSQIGGNFDTN